MICVYMFVCKVSVKVFNPFFNPVLFSYVKFQDILLYFE